MSATKPRRTRHLNFDITDGGVFIRFSVNHVLNLTIDSEDPDEIQANITAVRALLPSMVSGPSLAAILEGLDDLAAETGRTCEACHGRREIPSGPDAAVPCGWCQATGRILPATIAA